MERFDAADGRAWVEDFQVSQIFVTGTDRCDYVQRRAVSATRDCWWIEHISATTRDPVFLALPLVGCNEA